MLLESNMPKYMWNEAALTGVYLINRSPTKALTKDVTPAQMWNGYKPNISLLKVFGCKAYAWLPKQKRQKLDPKSQKLVMIGYVPNGYKLWDMNAKKIITARDVKFDETSFPYAGKNEEESQNLVIQSNIQEGDDDDINMPVTNNVSDLPNVSESHDLITSDEDDVVDGDNNDDDSASNHDDDVEIVDTQTPRRSQRQRKPPSKYYGFHFGYSLYTDDHNFVDVPDQFGDISGRCDADKW